MTNSWPPNCKLDAADTKRRRLIDRCPGGFIELTELQHRATEISARRKKLQHKRTSLADERTTLARQTQLHRRVHDFAAHIHAVIDTLDDTQKQQLLRLLIEDVRVTGWHVPIRLRIALDPPPDPTSPRAAALGGRRLAGVHVKAVAELLGHSSVNVTGGVYGHTSDGTARAAVDGGSGVLGL
jgi:hypothetical protein